ncbi:MAG: amidohydrolase family protein [Acidobacteria bacterium]|nr:amidohydrolase family protein [Acidobacteriota bacterium]
MRKKEVVFLLAVWGVIGLAGSRAQAQQAPDTILYNGKIVTVDNDGVNDQLGTIAQALAIRGTTISAVGSNAQIRAMAGPNTKSIDLKGRTVTPGLGVTHDHPQDWDPLNPYIVRKVVNDNMHIERFLWEEPGEQQVQMFPKVLEEAVQKAKPGQWIRISMLYGKEYRRESRDAIQGSFGRRITKQMLDMIAPNNPVVVRAGFVGTMINQKGLDEAKKWYGQWGQENQVRLNPQTQLPGSTSYRQIEQDVLYPQEELREIYRLGASWWTGYGLTTNSSAIYTAAAHNAYSTLDRNGQLAIRIPWSWLGSASSDFFTNPYFLYGINDFLGKGSDYFWMVAVWPPGAGSACTTLPGTSPEVKQNEAPCALDPNTPQGQKNRQAFYNYIRAGGRFAGAHTDGDKNMDYVMDIIEQASKDAGITIDQIRTKRHAWDHLAYNPRPDQIPRIKNLGIMLGGWDLYIYEKSGEPLLQKYGEEAIQWMVPRKSLLDGGVRESVEIDRPLGYTNLTLFHVLYTGITRKDQDGKVWGPQQAVSREVMLKSATLSAAYYARGEDKLGSLKPGKLADLIVLDRDYLTIPVDDILKIHVLMTLVGGKIEHLAPSFARELGMQPIGVQMELGGPAAQW